jgi:hypothetical protein
MLAMNLTLLPSIKCLLGFSIFHRIGVQKGVVPDWGDYYFHHFMPLSIRNESKWPSKPMSYR